MNSNFSKAVIRRRIIINVLLAALVSLVPIAASAHGGHKHVMGTVASVNLETIAVKTVSGTVAVPLAADTHYYHGSGTKNPAQAADVKDGMRVVVHLDARQKAAEIHIP